MVVSTASDIDFQAKFVNVFEVQMKSSANCFSQINSSFFHCCLLSPLRKNVGLRYHHAVSVSTILTLNQVDKFGTNFVPLDTTQSRNS